MSEFKPAPGEWSQGTSNEGSTCVWFHGIKEPPRDMGKDSEWIDCNTPDNAKLIADAGNTYHATGMTPSQLAERVKVLEDAFSGMVGAFTNPESGEIDKRISITDARKALSK